MLLTFIGICETWATQTYLLNMPWYKYEHCISSNNRGGGVSIYLLDTIQYKTRKNVSFSTHMFVSVFIEVDRSVFKSKRNIIIGEIYRPNKNTFN